MSSYEELLIKIRAASELGGFDALQGKVKQASTDMKGMESTTNASARKMKTDLEQVNNTNFSSMNSKFKSTISSMTSTAASGAKAIKTSLSSMVDGIDGAITTVAAGMGTMELFENAMSKALTTTQLKNAKPQDYSSIMSQYQKFTTASSASDDDINKMLRFTYSGNSDSTYKALNAVDAISYSADKLQRAEGIRGWGTYLSGGWSAASGMMRDEPLTGEQVKLLEGADTYEERIAAMETIAKQKGNVDKFGNSLSTTVDGPLGKYNQALAAEDAIIRGATTSFETLMTWISPVIFGFMSLDPGIQSIIGTILTAGIVVTAGATGLGLLIKVLSPVYDGFTKVKDALGGAKEIKNKISGLKDSLDGKKLVGSVSIKATSVYVNGKTTGTTGTGGTTTTTTGGTTGKGGSTSSGSRLSGLLPIAVGGLEAGGIAGLLGVGATALFQGFSPDVSKELSGLGLKGSAQNVLDIGNMNTLGLMGSIGSQFFHFGEGPVSQATYDESSSMAKEAQKRNLGDMQDVRGAIWGNLTSTGSWLQGAGGNTQTWLGGAYNNTRDFFDSSKDWKMPDLGIDKWLQDAHPTEDLKNWFTDTTKDWKLPNIDTGGAINTLKTDVTNGWNGAKNWVMSNPVIGGAITEVSNLFNDPHKFWSDAKSWVLSNPTVGKAWADAYALYSNVKSWWDAARKYVRDHTITPGIGTGSNGGGGGGFGSPESVNDELYGQGPYYEPIVTTPSTNTTTTVKEDNSTTINLTVGNVDSDDRVDQVVNALTIAITNANNAKGN